MCGICGVIDFDQNLVLEEELRCMNGTLIHRGPDGEGYFILKNVGLANRRLSVIDLKFGSQPIHNEDKSLWITFNGEIYNFQKTRVSLQKKNHRFYTKTDTECILHLYEEEGANFVKKLDGMFALAIWDEKKKELLLARDPMGKKPLYWALFGSKFVFASEPKAILALPDFKRVIDRGSLSKYFFYGYVPSPNTIFKGINRLSAGSFMRVRKNVAEEEKKYWEIDYSGKFDDLSNEERKDQVKSLLKKAVEKRLVADVPIGVFLSGGIDSSLVAAFIPPKKVEAFTIGFEDSFFDESVYAKMVADHLGIKQNIKIFKNSEVFDLFPEALELMDEPVADPSILPTYLLSAFTGQRVKVALSGDGGDENFAGYPKYLAHFFLRRTGLEKLPFLRATMPQKGKVGKLLASSPFPLYLRNQFWISSLSAEEIKRMTGVSLKLDELEMYHELFVGKEALDEALFLDQKMTMADQNLVKIDRASMVNSLEVRCPFLDKDLVQFAARLEFKDKIKGFKTKAILREIAGEFFPKDLYNRPKKGFGIPLKKWLDCELKDFKNHYLSIEKINNENLLNTQAVQGIINDNNPDNIWKLLVFEVWVEKWLK